MEFVILFILGLCLGSFVNALVWRLHEKQQIAGSDMRLADNKKTQQLPATSLQLTTDNNQLSILRGRSICPNCKHQLAAIDLVPIFSWLLLRGKCRYCGRPISWQYPVVELLTALVFLISYLAWPQGFDAQGILLFIFWLIFITGFVALAVYDLRWMLLPDKIMYPLLCLAIVQALFVIFGFGGEINAAWDVGLSLLISSGIFYVLFQISRGKWIGGGDIKLGALIGLILGKPELSLLMIFLSSVLGSIVAVPLLVTGRANRSTKLPFGPFLIAACVLVYILGPDAISWFKDHALFY